uniref:Uncharacterized protein n=1 Tax=Salarias fasciatus TaxID=181472 RepID=A0A672I943_SALFA
MPHKSRKEKVVCMRASSLIWSLGNPGNAVTLLCVQGSSRKAPPSTQLSRAPPPGARPALKRQNRLSSASFPLSTNRQLHRLPGLTGTHKYTQVHKGSHRYIHMYTHR